MPFYIRVTSLINLVHCITQTEEPYLLKLVIASDFTTQSKPLGGSTPQTPERISFSVGYLQAAADTFVII